MDVLDSLESGKSFSRRRTKSNKQALRCTGVSNHRMDEIDRPDLESGESPSSRRTRTTEHAQHCTEACNGSVDVQVDRLGSVERSPQQRSFKFDKKRGRRHLGSGAILRKRRAISYRILTAYEKAFEKFGFFVARKPLVVLLLSVFVIVASCLGFVRLNVDQPSRNQFIVIDSQSRYDLHNAAQFFPLLEARQEQIIMTPKHGQNILSEDCLKDAILTHQAFVNINGYNKLCFRQLQNITGKVPKEGCVISSPLELAGANFEHLTNLSSILALQRTNPRTVLSDGQLFQWSFKQMLSNFQVNNKTNPPIAWADALRIIYFIKKTANEADQEVVNFETSFESVALSVRRRLKCAALSFKTGKRTDDALQSLLQPDIRPLYLSALAMVLFVFLVIYLSYANLNCLTTILLTLLSVLLPQTCAAGIISMAGISLSPTSLFIPFLLMGKATSDVLLILGEWERQKKVPSLEHRVSSCVARAGTPQMLSAFCGAIILGIAIQSSFEVISGFFLVALTAFVIASFASLTITVTLLLYNENQLKSFNAFCARSCTTGSSYPSVQSFSVIQNLKAKLQHSLDSFARTLTSFGGRVISLFILTCMVSLCVLSALQSGERTSSTENLYRQNENFKLFDDEQKKLFGNETDVSIVFSQEVDYSQQIVQDQMINMCTTLGKATYSNGKSVCWMAALLQWANNRNISCLNSEFHRCLTTFLSLTHSVPFLQDLRFKVYQRRFQIRASRIHVQMAVHKSFKGDSKSLEKLRDDLSQQSSLNATPVSETFLEIDDLFSLEREVVFCLIIATVVVFVSCLFSTLSFGISTCLTVTFGLLLLETAGIMEAWGIHLNNITFISLLLTIILAFNFSLQTVHSFIFSGRQEEGERMIKALRSVGWCVLIATLLAVAGSASLGFIYPSLKHLFFQLIPLVFSLGLIHGLLILPPIMTLFGRFMESFDSQNEVDILQTQTNRKERGMSLQVWDFEASKVKSTRAAISIVGISCRFPGASGKDLFWNLLEQGTSSISAFPQNREESSKMFSQLYHPKRFVSGRLCAVNGSYMEDIMKFDNRFFGISNQEARVMDPQQRILLEVVYEAIEDAGLRLEDLQRCRTGVFVGVMNLEFGALLTDPSNYRNINQFSSTGISAPILANRVSFCLNLTGPSIAIDTACSSSLTALKIACDNLHNKDCDIAIVCAPNIILNHAGQIASSMAGLLAPDGRCKSFDASGDGYGRGEGFAAVILKLSDAACGDKDDEYCEIISCGMNNDGQNAVPMTAPSAMIQAELSRMVLEQSGLNPEDVDYVEAHGTGTAIGDVIETISIAYTYTRGTRNPARKLKVGSVKSNLNHTESTSGLAGLIKVALMIKKKRLVPTVNVDVVNPKLKLEEKGLVLQQTNEPWNTENGKPRIGAVNSFGFGGSNVHAILREVTSKQSFKEDNFKRLNHVFTISARSQDALKQMAENYSKWLTMKCKDTDTTFVEDLCYSLNERRSQFPHRLAVPFESISEASKSLADYADDSMGWENLVSYGEVESSNTNVVFMFGGQGSQWFAMGRQLIQSEAVFKEAILTIDALLRDFGNTWSLIDELMASEDQSRITENSIAQPATFAVQYATARLLMSWRIYPSAVLGHSLGEFAAASVAGILTLKEAVHLVLTRSTLQDQCPNNGGMAALGISEENARALLINLKLSATLNIAAVNDAESVTVSGDSQSIEALGQHLAMHAKDIFWRVLGTKRAFHSSHMESIKKPFQAAMKHVKLNPQLSKIPMYSTVTGDVLSGQEFNRDYWWRNIRCPVQFYTAMKHLLNDGYKQIIEISTQPILAHYVKQTAVQEKLQDQAMPTVLATLPRKRVPVNGQHKSFLLNTVCKLYALGFSIDWNCVQGNPSAKFVRSITYPWQENSFWYREHLPQTIISPLGPNKSEKKKTHPFLQKVKMTDLYSGLHCWETEIDLHRFPKLKDHALIQGGTVMPGAAYLEMAFAMAMDQFLHVAGLELSDVKLSSILTLPETQARILRLRLLKTERINEAKFHITSVQDDQSEIKLSTGSISLDLLQKQKNFVKQASDDVGPVVKELMTNMTKMPMERFREITETLGFNYGPDFSIIKEIWECDNKGLCLVDISESLTMQTETESYVVHPSILDACLQSCFVPLGSSLTDNKSIVPVGFKRITLNGVPSTYQLYCHVTADVTEFGRFDVTLMTPSGDVLLKMTDFRVAELTSSPRQLVFSELAYEVQWNEAELPKQRESTPHLTCIVLNDSSDFSDNVVTRLQAFKVNVITVNLPNVGCFDTEAENAIETVFAAIPQSNSSNLKIVNMWPVETSLLPDNFDVIEQAQRLAFSSSVFLLKLLMQKDLTEARLFLVTECTQLMNACNKPRMSKSIPWGSTVWGLRRTANLEGVDLWVTSVDLCKKEDLREADLLVDEILSDSTEQEVAFRDGKRFMNRLIRSDRNQKKLTITNRNENNKRLLYLSTIPSSEILCLRERSVSKPSHSEVAIEVQYFWTPSESISDVAKPKACVFLSGKVLDLPEERKHTLRIGDEVCAVIPSGRVGRSVLIYAYNAFVKPVRLTAKQATYLPACLALASHALQKAVLGSESQKLLIHQANRGPGPASVVLGKTLGHRVFCTISDCCTTSTKSLLLKLGAESVSKQSCPSLRDDPSDYFDAIVFFYPPSPNALHVSGKSLKPGGRVVILSSRFGGDVVFPANKNVKYEREDPSGLLQCPLVYEKLSLQSLELLDSKGVLEQLLGMQLECLDFVASIKAANGSLEERSFQQYEVRESSDLSFRIQSFTTVEDENQRQDIAVLPRGLDECGLKENRTYLIAGGMRGFGFEVACWMAETGAKSIALLGRSKPSDAKLEEVRQIEKRTGAKIHAFQVDVSKQDQMSSLKERLHSLPSVAGIVHTAMVLRDEFIKDLTFQSFIEVMGPKINGSFLLHQMSLEMDLDFFVMFSSMASVLGNEGQSSYSACNSFQDSLAQYRRHVLGLPGLSINWGPISGAGVMEREAAIAKLLSVEGFGFINAKEGVEHMAKVLTEEPSRCQISLFNVDWPRLLTTNKRLRTTTRLSIITSTMNIGDRQTNSTESSVQRIILEKDREKRAELISEYVGLSAASWTGISSPSETDLNKSLYFYGVDSTAALTLKMQLEGSLGVSFEVYYFMQPDTTLIKLARDINDRLSGQHEAERNSQPSDEQPQDSDSKENEPAQSLATTGTVPVSQIQVVRLYTPEGSSIKFFCVHPSHRYAMSLVPISTGFQGQDLVSFYALGFTDPTAVSEDWGGVRELATHYVQLISKEQRHGPYFLGGYSYGGLVAYEIASLLTEQNQRVEFVAMIDTFPYSPRWRTVIRRLASMQEDVNSQRLHVELQFEKFLKKLAVDSLKMTMEEYQQLRENCNQEWIIDKMQKRSLEKGLTFYNLRALKDSLLREQEIASRTHQAWQPPKVRYRGPLTFLKCQNTCFSPRTRSPYSVEEMWGQLVDGGTTVLVCPGDHYSMSEAPHAHVTGSILATALAFNYRVLFPEFPRPTRTFSQRRAVEKLFRGINVFLHSKKGNKRPHFGELHFEEDAMELQLTSKADEGVTNEEEKIKKIIKLKDLRMVQPGRVVSSALKYAGLKRRVGAHYSSNLGQIASVITNRRVYNLEFTDYSDLKAFYSMIEAVFAVTLLSR